MKTEFNVERVCERLYACIVEAPDVMCVPGPPHFEVRKGSLYVTFPKALVNSIEVRPGPGHPEWDGEFGELINAPSIDPEEVAKAREIINAAVAESNAQNAIEAGSIANALKAGE